MRRKYVEKDLLEETFSQILNIHYAIISQSGGEQGVRDDGGLLYSLYKLLKKEKKAKINPFDLAAFALVDLSRKHYFVDGNKRTAYLFAKLLLTFYNYHLVISYQEAVSFYNLRCKVH